MRKVTIQDVAREAGTSVSTVSRVLTGNAPVSSDKRRAVEAAVERLGFHPSHVARSLRTRATQTISLLINDITNPFYSVVARGIEDEANRLGYSLILCNTNDDPARERQYLNVLRAKQVDGIIFGPTGENVDLIQSMARRIPMVLVDRRLDAVPVTAIVADNEGGAHAAVQHLIERGHRQIGIVMWEPELTTLSERYAGASRAMTEAGLILDPALVLRVPRAHPEQIAYEVTCWLGKAKPTALFALNNQLGVGTLHALHDLGLRIPQEMGLIVFDDLEVFQLTDPPISAVAQPAAALGRRAMQALARRIEHPDEPPPGVLVLPTELILRGSV